MEDYNMYRRTLLTATLAAISSSVAGCLENRVTTGDSNDSGDNDGTGDNDMNNDGTDDNDTNDSSDDASNDSNNQADQDSNHDEDIRETRFEVLGSNLDFEISVSITFETDLVTVSGTIVGNNSCYTARLEEISIENRSLIVNVESYEDRDEDEGCMEAEYGIDYEAVVEFDGEPPPAVTVKHNGEEVTTEQRP